MQQYKVTVLPGDRSEAVVSMLRDLALRHLIELDQVSSNSTPSDDQVLEMIEEADLTAHYSLEEARDILHIGNRR
ncbi:hypothetical protein [Dyadobacter aurulentus]|uniref:hypothetical protein n=1 Tax=Dyadobacter sp. UC 10 TaxID=2605428 RepID=UPI0011F2CC76|nr:hypothetical protein [Dyadobacter sp. UC 10]KAA0989222.1 hypothetical protein FXO21_03120 [Dyadobacter sp. UC 10]